MQAEERDPENFLIDILGSIEKIENFIKGFEFEDFSQTRKLRMPNSGSLNYWGSNKKFAGFFKNEAS